MAADNPREVFECDAVPNIGLNVCIWLDPLSLSEKRVQIVEEQREHRPLIRDGLGWHVVNARVLAFA